MRRGNFLLATLLTAGSLATVNAQTALDAYQLAQPELRGTARFVGMAGAFTALGGDLSTLGQNPGGIGVYRYSEIGATLNIDNQHATTSAQGLTTPQDQTWASCPNFGYIGSVSLGSQSVMPYLNWGLSYGRVASFNRHYRGSIPTINTSLSNYVAAYTESEGWTTSELNGYYGADPYYDTYAPWMSILMYNAYAINPSSLDSTDYDGLYNGTSGSAEFDVFEKGYTDEYNINFGGNILNTVYWGFGFGITDIEYTNDTYYSELFNKATIANADANGRTEGSAQMGLSSWKHIWGTGFNFKIGVIVKPIDEFRIGVAFHTPTYYNLNYEGNAQTGFSYVFDTPVNNAYGIQGTYPTENENSAYDYFSWQYRSPMRFMAGVAGVIDRKAIISLDYELRNYGNMAVKDQWGVTYGEMSNQIQTYYKNSNTLRLGVEYRLTPAWTVRAGYSYTSSPVTAQTSDGLEQVFTSGPDDTETQPSFALDRDQYYITAGFGWHYQNFYADAAYVYQRRNSTWHAFTNYWMTSADGQDYRIDAPSATVADNRHQIVLSMGFKF